MNLVDAFQSLEAPKSDDAFNFCAIPIPGFEHHRLAKDKDGNPSILISAINSTSIFPTSNLKLKNLSVFFNVNCSIQQVDNIINKQFSVISYVGSDRNLINYFFKLSSNLINELGITPTQSEIHTEISNFIELFRLSLQPPRKSIQGLWAEIFIIATSKNPIELLNCWHVTPEDIFDFNAGPWRIEVKSSSTNHRIHNFSLEQLNPPEGTVAVIASILMKQSSIGKSIEDLRGEIQDKITLPYNHIVKLDYQIAHTLGSSIHDISNIKYDFELAKSSLNFYAVENVPKISQSLIPDMVFDVKFKSDLSQTESITPSIFCKDSSLFLGL